MMCARFFKSHLHGWRQACWRNNNRLETTQKGAAKGKPISPGYGQGSGTSHTVSRSIDERGCAAEQVLSGVGKKVPPNHRRRTAMHPIVVMDEQIMVSLGKNNVYIIEIVQIRNTITCIADA